MVGLEQIMLLFILDLMLVYELDIMLLFILNLVLGMGFDEESNHGSLSLVWHAWWDSNPQSLD